MIAPVTVPDVPEEVAAHLSVPDEATIGLLVDHPALASNHTVWDEVDSVKANVLSPNRVPDKTTFDEGVEASEVEYEAVTRY